MKNDAFGDRMKDYERRETGQKFLPMIPIYARLDGVGFSKFTKGFDYPYDPRLRAAMTDTTKWLLDRSNARIGYTQSDEISLCWLANRYDSQVFFDGKKQKMVSVLASMATQRFNQHLLLSGDAFLIEAAGRAPCFDVRVFQLPNRTECANAFLWRELDATKNALSMAARAHYSHKRLMHKGTAELHELLYQAGQNFNDYPAEFKRGSYVQKRQYLKTLTEEELAKIPLNKRPDDNSVLRSHIETLDMPPLSRVSNREDVIFEGASPILYADINEE